MSCREIAFAHGTCRLTIEQPTERPEDARYVARVSVLDDQHTTCRPLVFDDGTPVEIHGPSEAAVENNAIGFCERYFGAYSQTMHPCEDFGRTPAGAEPMVVGE